MKHFISTSLLAFTLAVSVPAQADRVVMTFCDSRCNTSSSGSTNWPTMLDNQRADFIVCNKGLNGRRPSGGLADIATAIAQCQAMGTLTDGVILLGVNAMLDGVSSDVATDQIRDIAAHIEAAGVVPWIVAEPPGPIAWGGYVFMNAYQYTQDNVNLLRQKNAVGTLYPIIEVRDALLKNLKAGTTLVPGYWFRKYVGDTASCSNDDLHPTNPTCRQQIFADTVSAAIP